METRAKSRAILRPKKAVTFEIKDKEPVEVPERDADTLKYYDRYMASDVNDKRKLQDEIMYQLFKNTKENKSTSPKIQDPIDHAPNKVQQADLLYMPTDDGYMYGLTVVDCGSRLTECQPLRDRTSKAVLEGLKEIYKRKVISIPSVRMEVDDGSEFKKDFADFFKKKEIFLRVAEPGRSRQQGLVENRNGLLARTLMRRMVAEELLTGVKSVEWVHYLPKLLKLMNDKYYQKKVTLTPEELMAPVKIDNQSRDLLENGTSVRIKLDKPVNHLTNRREHGGFRQGDVRWSIKPTTILRLQLIPGQPVLYKVKGKKALYTRNQIQIINETSRYPPSSVQFKFVIDKILKKKKVNGLFKYLVKWENEPADKATWESREQLLEDAPDVVEEFDKKK